MFFRIWIPEHRQIFWWEIRVSFVNLQTPLLQCFDGAIRIPIFLHTIQAVANPTKTWTSLSLEIVEQCVINQSAIRYIIYLLLSDSPINRFYPRKYYTHVRIRLGNCCLPLPLLFLQITSHRCNGGILGSFCLRWTRIDTWHAKPSLMNAVKQNGRSQQAWL